MKPIQKSPAVAINLSDDGSHLDIAIRGRVGDLGRSSDDIGEALGHDVKTVTIFINSLGGYAHEGIGLHNMLKAHPAKVDVVVEGVAGSAASVVAMSASAGCLAMTDPSLMMIHGTVIVDADGEPVKGQEKMAATFDDALARIYCARTGKSDAEVRRLMAAVTWMNAREAVASKFADIVLTVPTPGAPTSLNEAIAIAHGEPKLAKTFRPPPKAVDYSEVWRRAIARSLAH